MNTMDRMKKLLSRLDLAWREFQDTYQGLSEMELLTPGVTGTWSIKDIIAHVTTWEVEALKHLPLILRGEKLPKYSVRYGGIDAFNAQATANKKDLSLAEVLREQARVHQKLVDLIESIPEEHLEGKTRFCHRLRLDTYKHYQIHTAAIQKWRSARKR